MRGPHDGSGRVDEIALRMVHEATIKCTPVTSDSCEGRIVATITKKTLPKSNK